MNTLFVCKSNVGRSQIAEAIFRQLSKEKHFVQSAGIEALGDEGKNLDGMLLKDRDSSKYVIECLKEIGIDVSNSVIKKLTSEMVKNSDKIFIMVKSDTVPEFLKENSKVIYWDIEDPSGKTLENHRQTRDKIKELIEKILDLV
jgi:protein-tyrosine-phosphatase